MADAAKAPVLLFVWIGKRSRSGVIEIRQQRLLGNSASTL
jgi:hypothetical protein